MATTTHTIPLRKAFQQSAPLKRAPKAVRAIKIYVQKHAKVDIVKIGPRLNTALWTRGITNPPHKVTVNVIVEDSTAKVELEGFSYEEAKKIVKKQEPQSLKEKIQDKIGAPKQDRGTKEQETPVEKPKTAVQKETPEKTVATTKETTPEQNPEKKKE